MGSFLEIGNNINQVAHQLNSGAITGVIDQRLIKTFNELMDL
jgi:hypothetical protein